MADIIYKKLFSVQLLHEYYLLKNDGTSLFDGDENKDDVLLAIFNSGVPSVSESFLYEKLDVSQVFFENYQLRIVPEYSGFSVMTRAIRQNLPGGITGYKPLIKLPDDLNILVQLSLKNNLINAVTDRRINKSIPAAYYFTNEDIITPRIFPNLSASIPAYNTAYSYEQGELYINDQNKVCLFYIANNGPSLLPVTGNNYANTNDELVVPLQFTYKFNEEDSVTNASFQLNDHTGKTVRNYVFTNDSAIKSISLNFKYNQSANINVSADNIVKLPGSSVTEENIYTLNVKVNNAKTYVHRVIFFETVSGTEAWAIISIKPVAANADFSIYDEGGLIKYRKQSDGSETPAPVFEIRIKSRNTFWRYINDKNGKLIDSHGPFLHPNGNNLVTSQPRAASHETMFFGTTPPFTEYLPNPESNEIKIEDRKFYTDIRVPRSDMFPITDSS